MTSHRCELTIRHDERGRRFYAAVDGDEAYLRYRPAGAGRLDYVSTWVPQRHRGHGIGTRIVQHALDDAREQGYRVLPSCPFVRWVLEQHPEHHSLSVA